MLRLGPGLCDADGSGSRAATAARGQGRRTAADGDGRAGGGAVDRLSALQLELPTQAAAAARRWRKGREAPAQLGWRVDAMCGACAVRLESRKSVSTQF